MNTNEQMPSGIDYFTTFSQPDGEALFTRLSEEFWNMSRNKTEETSTRHTLHRLQWLGDWLATQQGWKSQNVNLSPLNAIYSYLIIHHNLTAAEVAGMSVDSMNQVLADEWAAFKATRGAKDFLRDVERRLDKLDDPFTGRH
ncbi:hypothetical protein IBZ12_21495 [Serratia ureilytica]|uniref:hypothetical protein n=1 Tax=Serratia ureilytica TaxID=300181 RepID=UPI0039B5E9EC